MHRCTTATSAVFESMDVLLQYIDSEGMDASELDETVAEYIIQLASEGGEEEVWSVMEGCYPELEEQQLSKSKEAFSEVFLQLRNPSPPEPSSTASTTQHQQQQMSLEVLPHGRSHDNIHPLAEAGGSFGAAVAKDRADVDFLREMMPHVSDRGLRYVLHRVAKGSKAAAASYLADRCTGGSSSTALKRLEADAEACERKEMGDARKVEEDNRRAEEAKKRDKEERNALKHKIVGRYADEIKAEGGMAKVAVPSLTEKKKTTRYRDGKVVTTTGAKVKMEGGFLLATKPTHCPHWHRTLLTRLCHRVSKLSSTTTIQQCL
ncbi:unnamed protein product [Pylaiella littoralis]